ncbi:hypothetical protein P7C71_g553, partial [Lecanoromycetidae sp. Uapishka_2]
MSTGSGHHYMDDSAHIKENEEQLRLFAADGGPDLSDIIGYSHPKDGALDGNMPPRSQNPAQSVSSRSSAYNPDFTQKLRDAFIYDSAFRYARPKPANLEEILNVMTEPLRLPSSGEISEETHAQFVDATHAAINEDTWMLDAFPILRGVAPFENGANCVFNNFKPLAGDALKLAKPDFWDGVEAGALKKQVRVDLGEFIIPSTVTPRPILPNFLLEAKGGAGNGLIANQQACYDGALGARAMHQLLSYGKDPSTTYDENAYTITVTYNFFTITFFAHHTTPTTDFEYPAAYHMTPLKCWAIWTDFEQYRQAVIAFRNLRYWANEKRNELIIAANAVEEAYDPSLSSSDRRVSASTKNTSESPTTPAATSDHELVSYEKPSTKIHDGPDSHARDPSNVEGHRDVPDELVDASDGTPTEPSRKKARFSLDT